MAKEKFGIKEVAKEALDRVHENSFSLAEFKMSMLIRHGITPLTVKKVLSTLVEGGALIEEEKYDDLWYSKPGVQTEDIVRTAEKEADAILKGE